MYKQLIKPLLALSALALGANMAVAQDAYPNKPIKLVVPYAAGGPADLLARSVADKLSPRLGQPVLIDNKPGAGGHTGGELVASTRV
jgi:tripartite-type tricarboxylate transporter receptor subunit TctC